MKKYHDIYRDAMIQAKHGYPVFHADPAGLKSLERDEGPPRIEIGDVGYFGFVVTLTSFG